MTALLDGLVEGPEDDAIGWVLDGIGFGGDDDSQLDAIERQLDDLVATTQRIEQQVTALRTQVAQLQAELTQGTYDELVATFPAADVGGSDDQVLTDLALARRARRRRLRAERPRRLRRLDPRRPGSLRLVRERGAEADRVPEGRLRRAAADRLQAVRRRARRGDRRRQRNRRQPRPRDRLRRRPLRLDRGRLRLRHRRLRRRRGRRLPALRRDPGAARRLPHAVLERRGPAERPAADEAHRRRERDRRPGGAAAVAAAGGHRDRGRRRDRLGPGAVPGPPGQRGWRRQLLPGRRELDVVVAAVGPDLRAVAADRVPLDRRRRRLDAAARRGPRGAPGRSADARDVDRSDETARHQRRRRAGAAAGTEHALPERRRADRRRLVPEPGHRARVDDRQLLGQRRLELRPEPERRRLGQPRLRAGDLLLLRRPAQRHAADRVRRRRPRLLRLRHGRLAQRDQPQGPQLRRARLRPPDRGAAVAPARRQRGAGSDAERPGPAPPRRRVPSRRRSPAAAAARPPRCCAPAAARRRAAARCGAC